jgi:hypothetical protein
VAAGANGGGGLWWSESMMVAAFMRPRPCHFHVNLIGADTERSDAMIFIYLKKCVVALRNVNGSVATVLHSNDGPTHPLLLYNHCSDRIVATGPMCYGLLV